MQSQINAPPFLALINKNVRSGGAAGEYGGNRNLNHNVLNNAVTEWWGCRQESEAHRVTK